MRGALVLISDAVINNIVTTIGAVLTSTVTTVAVILSRRSTKRHLTRIENDLGETRRDLHSAGLINSSAIAQPVATDRAVQRSPFKDPGQAN